MSNTTLQALRFVVPGVMILTVFSFLFPSFQRLYEFLGSLEGVLYLVIVLPIGYVYDIANFRGPFLRDSLSLINTNIKERLTAPFRAEDPIGSNVESLTQGRQLINVFYTIVDKDPSLKLKSQRVYFNGLLWSTTADVMAIASFFVPVYILAYLVKPLPHYLPVALGLCIAYVLAALFFMPRVTSRHIKLSNDQLDFILQHHRDALCKKLIDLVSSASPAPMVTTDDPEAQ